MKNRAFKLMGITAVAITLVSLEPIQNMVDDTAFQLSYGAVSLFKPVSEKRLDSFHEEVKNIRNEYWSEYKHAFEKENTILGLDKDDMEDHQFYKMAMEELSFDKKNLAIHKKIRNEKINPVEVKPIVIDLISLKDVANNIHSLKNNKSSQKIKPA